MTSSLSQGMDFWGLCRLIGDAVAMYALLMLVLAAIRVPSRIVLEITDASAGGMMLSDQAARSMI